MKTIPIRLPLDLHFTLVFEVDLVENDVPIMFGLKHHKEHLCSTNKVHNTFMHHPSGSTIPIELRQSCPGKPELGGNLFLKWPIYSVLYTEAELKKLHKTFGPQSTEALHRLLKKVNPEKDVQPEVKTQLENIANCWKSCQTWASKPTRFRVSFRSEELHFNHEIEVGLMWVDGDIDRVHGIQSQGF